MRCLEPVKIIEILRLSEKGYSQRQIAKSVKCAKSTVGDVQRRCREQELTYQQAEGMTNDEIKALLYPANIVRNTMKPEPEWQEIDVLLSGKNRLNRQFLWEEYRVNYPEGLCYSQFCRRYEQWRHKTGKDVIMSREREPGREMFVDWMGDTLSCVLDNTTGELLKAHFFVATLGDSGYPYVEAFPDEKIAKWLTAHVHALDWMGGIPRVHSPG